jgi:hypothetical protein
MWSLGRLPDTGHEYDLVRRNIFSGQGLFNALQYGKIPASRTPGSLILTKIFNRYHINLMLP